MLQFSKCPYLISNITLHNDQKITVLDEAKFLLKRFYTKLSLYSNLHVVTLSHLLIVLVKNRL